MHLAADCKSILGVDISQSMVDLYNERVSNQGIEPSEMHAVVKDLKGNPDELEGRKFDVIVVSGNQQPLQEDAMAHLTSIRSARCRTTISTPSWT